MGVLFLLARKKGWLSKPMSRAKSVRLTDVNNQDSYSEEEGSPNHVATNPIGTVGGGLDGSTELPENLPNEKAMSQLGLQMTYSASRRVM